MTPLQQRMLMISCGLASRRPTRGEHGQPEMTADNAGCSSSQSIDAALAEGSVTERGNGEFVITKAGWEALQYELPTLTAEVRCIRDRNGVRLEYVANDLGS
jgi:hypothetical protein